MILDIHTCVTLFTLIRKLLEICYILLSILLIYLTSVHRCWILHTTKTERRIWIGCGWLSISNIDVFRQSFWDRVRKGGTIELDRFTMKIRGSSINRSKSNQIDLNARNHMGYRVTDRIRENHPPPHPHPHPLCSCIAIIIGILLIETWKFSLVVIWPYRVSHNIVTIISHICDTLYGKSLPD